MGPTEARRAEPRAGPLAARRHPPPARELGLVAAGSLLLLVAVDAAIRHEHGQSGDEVFYSRMAAHPGGPHNFPYAYRVGVPWLVHVLPFSHVVSFTLLAWLAMAAGGAALYALLRDHAVGRGLAVGLVAGFLLSPVLLVVLVRHGRSVDPASVLVIVLGVLWTVRRRRVALALTILAGTTIRESSLFLIPLAYAVWAERPLDRRAFAEVAAVAAAPLTLYVVLRLSIDAVGREYIPGYTGPFLSARWAIVRQALSGSSLGQEARRLAYTYGPLWLAAPPAIWLRAAPADGARPADGPPPARFLARRGLVLVAACFAAMTFAFDWGRIVFLAAPVFYVGAAAVVGRRPRLAAATVAALLLVDLGYAVYLHVHGVAAGIDTAVGHGIPVY